MEQVTEFGNDDDQCRPANAAVTIVVNASQTCAYAADYRPPEQRVIRTEAGLSHSAAFGKSQQVSLTAARLTSPWGTVPSNFRFW